MPLDIHAFIFDLDGVITDTAEYHYQAWQRIADSAGIPFTREENEGLKGLSRRASLDRMLKGRPIDEETAQAWMTRKNDLYLELLTGLNPRDLLPGVRPLLESAAAAGLKLGVASASRNATIVLERLGVRGLFGVVGDGFSVVRSKPAPDIFVWAAGALGVRPPHSVVFEDSEAGIEGANAAGFHTVGLGGGAVGAASVVLPTLEGATAESIIAALHARLYG
jgi:beta-phosphoglucomutase